MSATTTIWAIYEELYQDDKVAFIALISVVNNHTPEAFVFDSKAHIYDFIRSAQSTIRENMTSFLNQPDVLYGYQDFRRRISK